MPKAKIASKDRLQRELWALALLLLSILLALSFVPPSVLGESASPLFPTGNIVGNVGAFISQAAWVFFGAAAFLIPFLPAVWAAGVLTKIRAGSTTRLSILVFGSLALVPTGIYAASRPTERIPAAAGWVGVALGRPLTTELGWVGAAILVFFLLVALFIGTVRWNPLRSFARGGGRVWAGIRQMGGATAYALSGRWLRRRSPKPARLDAPSVTADQDLTLPFEPEVTDDDPTLAIEPAPKKRRLPASGRKARRSDPKEPKQSLFPDSGDPLSPDLPSTALLAPAPPRDEATNRRHLDGLGKVLIEKLATFKIAGEIVGTTTGPVVTQFEVSPAPGIKVARIANLEADLALAMRAPSVRIVAPIPGKAAVGVEVPNPEAEIVYFREVIESRAFRNSRAKLPLALGKDLSGRPYVADLARMPHLLIAGATGSGKSVCINTIITSLVFRHSPQSLRLLMVDPKMVELSVYNDLPHLRHPVVTDNSEAAGILKWAVLEMEWRYALLSANNVRNLHDFNQRVEDGLTIRAPEPQGEEGDPDRWIYKGGALPYIVLMIDELADLMMTVQGEVEKPLALLAQKARAIGIHLILATQRPSVNVITGLIKANFPSRIAFRVASKVDSRTILDQNGADSLLGNGDMLFLPPGQSDPLRLQGAFLSTEETEDLMGWYRERARERAEDTVPDTEAEVPGEPDILEIVRAAEAAREDISAADEALEDRDKLFHEAAELCIQQQGGSTSLLQRRLRIGYGRAARIIDQLHHAGILGPADGSKPREVLVDFVQLEQLYPDD
ncbi:MAG: hypothetical protein GEU90_10345 [Gemmatimonas sp.]|nr:hypothetical protein [Gemmatimonas sp.]